MEKYEDKYEEKRPWGKFERFTLNRLSTVKIITVEPEQQLSLQLHHNREEFWRILSGEAEVIVGEETVKAKKDSEFFIPKETKHSIKTGDSRVEFLEISFGQFDERDEIRLEDKYGRA